VQSGKILHAWIAPLTTAKKVIILHSFVSDVILRGYFHKPRRNLACDKEQHRTQLHTAKTNQQHLLKINCTKNKSKSHGAHFAL
jgi:hypothetical protein